MADPFPGMTLTVSLAGSPDLLTGMRVLHDDADWAVYDRYWITGGTAFLVGARVNKSTNEHTFCVWLNYGHQDWNVDKPVQVFVSTTLTWDSGAGSLGPFILDDPPAGGIVENGQTIPPVVVKWNGTTKTQVGTEYLGLADAFIQTSRWKAYPGAPGSSIDRFTFRYDPAVSVSGYKDLLPGMMYGGAWLGADGQRIRPDLLQFHSADYGSWYQGGKLGGGGWWLSPKLDTTGLRRWFGEGWWFMPGGQHADSGVGHVVRSFYHGGPEFWTDPTYHFYIVQIAARYLNHHPHPLAGYASEFRTKYQGFANRQQGRIVGFGVWVWRCLLRLNNWSTDPQVAAMLAEIGPRVLAIFNRIYDYSKPYALPGEDPPPPGWGYWHRLITLGPTQLGHPEGGANRLLDFQPYQGGILWQGIYHLWEALGEFGLTAAPEYARTRHLMDFISFGHGQWEGLWDLFFKWKNSHPYPPPDPLPPAWSTTGLCPGQHAHGCWGPVKKYTLGGYGWGHEFWHLTANGVHSNDFRYLSGPSAGTFDQQAPMIDFINQVGGVNTTKMTEILSDISGLSYQMRLGNRMSKGAADTVSVEGDDAGYYKSLVVGLMLWKVVTETVAVDDSESGVNLGQNKIVRWVDEEVTAIEENYRRKQIRRVSNNTLEVSEMAWRGGASGRTLVKDGEEFVEIGPVDEEPEGHVRLTSPVNVGATISGVSRSVGDTLYSN